MHASLILNVLHHGISSIINLLVLLDVELDALITRETIVMRQDKIVIVRSLLTLALQLLLLLEALSNMFDNVSYLLILSFFDRLRLSMLLDLDFLSFGLLDGRL